MGKPLVSKLVRKVSIDSVLTWNREQDELQYPIAEEFVGCKSIRVWTK
jgi:hypothetical protein